MTKTTTTVNAAAEAERLVAEAAEATARADQARARADKANRLAAAQRQAELDAIRRRRLAEFDEAALEADVTAGRHRFAEAVREGDPALSEFIGLQVAMTQRYIVSVEAEQCRAALEPERPRIPTGGPGELNYSDELQRVLTTMAGERVTALQDQMQAELDRAGK